MKRTMLFLLVAVLAVSCVRGGGYRRENPDDENESVRMVENPYWKLYYEGRLPVEDGGGWYVCDIVGNEASDNENYYLSVISSETFSRSYGSNVYRFCVADLADLKKQGIALSFGSSEVYFDVLDDGGGEYTAIAYGVGSDGRLTGSYKKGVFKTEKIQARETDTWKLSYTGREKDEDGAVVDVIDISAATRESYRVDVTYDEYLSSNFDGDLMAYFNALADNWFESEVSLDYGSVTYLFDRLTTGVDWTAYAIGFDANGNPTGRYSKLDFVIPSEEPTEDFLSWTGRWKIGSGKTGMVDNGKITVEDKAASYDITIASNDPNWDYVVSGWETGDFAVNQAAWEGGIPYDFIASYDRESGKLLFGSQNVGWSTDGDGEFDIMLYGNFVYKGGQYFVTDMMDIAEASAGSDPGTAVVKGLPVRVIMDDAAVVNTEFTSMQYYDIYGTGKAYFYNDVPQFPLNMAYLGHVAATAPTKAASGAGIARRKVSVHQRSQSAAPEAGVRTLSTRKASGSRMQPKAEKSKTNVGQAIGTRAKVN